MAKVKIDGAVVYRIIEGHGFVATTQAQTRNGKTITEYWTVWSDARVALNDVVDITGDLSVRMDEYKDKNGQTKQGAAGHINNAVVKADTPF